MSRFHARFSEPLDGGSADARVVVAQQVPQLGREIRARDMLEERDRVQQARRVSFQRGAQRAHGAFAGRGERRGVHVEVTALQRLDQKLQEQDQEILRLREQRHRLERDQRAAARAREADATKLPAAAAKPNTIQAGDLMLWSRVHWCSSTRASRHPIATQGLDE